MHFDVAVALHAFAMELDREDVGLPLSWVPVSDRRPRGEWAGDQRSEDRLKRVSHGVGNRGGGGNGITRRNEETESRFPFFELRCSVTPC